jgi:hypothetical protein
VTRRKEKHIKTNLTETGTDSGLCLMTSFGISGVNLPILLPQSYLHYLFASLKEIDANNHTEYNTLELKTQKSNEKTIPHRE